MNRFVALALLMVAAPATAQNRTLRVGDTSVAIERGVGGPVVPLSAVAAIGGRVQLTGAVARVTLLGDTLQFTSWSPFFTVNGRPRQLAAPALRNGAGFLVPLQFFSDYLPRAYSQRLSYQDGQLRSTQGSIAAAPRDSSGDAATSRGGNAQQGAAAPGRGAAPPRDPRDSPGTRKIQRIVVLDAGHGGKDTGKPGPNGLLEKTAALSVVNRLAGYLRERGFEVHLTRSADTLISLADRPHFANEWKKDRPAAVFVSIHANAGVRAAKGFETYFLSEARTDDERRVAEMENEAVQFEDRRSPNAPDLDLIVSGLRNDFYMRASNDLAELVQQNLQTVHPGPNRGVKQAGFRVLVGALMPAVLVEMGFISNPEEARLLGTTAFQEKIAWSLAQAIERFFATHEAFFITGL